MYLSNVTAKDFIAEIKEELDIAPAVPDALFVRWLTALEQLLYTEIVREERWVRGTVEEGDGGGGEDRFVEDC